MPRAILTASLAALALLAGWIPAGAPAQAKPKPVRACLDARVAVGAGEAVKLRLDCRVRRAGRAIEVAAGARGVRSRTILKRPAKGGLSRFRPRAGTVRYRARPGAKGADRVRFRVVKRDGRRFRGLIRIAVRPAATDPDPDPGPDPDPDPEPGEIPAPLPEGTAPAITFSVANWAPKPVDTCPASLHERFSVIGPDGLKYPSWHPPVVTDPATGRPCTFGHEHGRDPRGSDLHDWVAGHFAAPGRERFAGIPFGVASQALETWSRAAATPVRREDNPGYKVDYRNDVRLYAKSGADLGVTCDVLVRYHQGSHSPDATSNNVHETLFAIRCDDGTEVISNAFTRFGDPGEYIRGCDPGVVVPTTDNGYPGGEGGRLIPDRACMETHFLVGPGRTTSAFALWEQWIGQNRLHTGDDPEAGRTLASFYTRFDLFDPARYADPDPAATPAPGYATRIGRPLDLCWEALPGGARVDRSYAPCATATRGWTVPFEARPAYDSPESPFVGAQREVRLRGVSVANADGPTAWYTDPYGGNASTEPFPGSICQLVSSTDNTGQPEVQERTFRGPDLGGQGVHPPN